MVFLITNKVTNNRNYTFAQALPTGLVCLGTNQIAGRGKFTRVVAIEKIEQ